MAGRQRVLFLCTGNACRSQMAEAWAKSRHAERIEAASAGVAPASTIDPRAVRVMHEIGIDMAGERPKHVREFDPASFDLVVTVCDHARETCPVLRGAKRNLHRGFDDPPHLAVDAKTEEEALAHYRRVRDEIGAWIDAAL